MTTELPAKPLLTPPTPLWGWPQLAVLLLTVAYLVPFAVICVRGGNREFILYLGVMLTLIPTVAWLHQRIRLHVGTLWGLSLWGLAHLAGGLVHIPESWPHDDSLVLYDWWLIPQRLRYDQVIHALGFGLTTWMCWQGLRGAFQAAGVVVRPTFGLLALCVFGGMGLGALNEIVEFLAVLTLPNTNVGGYVNTGWDLVANGVGALCAALAIAGLTRSGT
jgi:hypothetical protein